MVFIAFGRAIKDLQCNFPDRRSRKSRISEYHAAQLQNIQQLCIHLPKKIR